MAKRLETYNPSPRRGPKPVYPWDQWLGGEIWKIYRGKTKDYTLPDREMAKTIRRTATRKGVPVSVYTDSPGVLVIVPRGSRR